MTESRSPIPVSLDQESPPRDLQQLLSRLHRDAQHDEQHPDEQHRLARLWLQFGKPVDRVRSATDLERLLACGFPTEDARVAVASRLAGVEDPFGDPAERRWIEWLAADAWTGRRFHEAWILLAGLRDAGAAPWSQQLPSVEMARLVASRGDPGAFDEALASIPAADLLSPAERAIVAAIAMPSLLLDGHSDSWTRLEDLLGHLQGPLRDWVRCGLDYWRAPRTGGTPVPLNALRKNAAIEATREKSEAAGRAFEEAMTRARGVQRKNNNLWNRLWEVLLKDGGVPVTDDPQDARRFGGQVPHLEGLRGEADWKGMALWRAHLKEERISPEDLLDDLCAQANIRFTLGQGALDGPLRTAAVGTFRKVFDAVEDLAARQMELAQVSPDPYLLEATRALAGNLQAAANAFDEALRAGREASAIEAPVLDELRSKLEPLLQARPA